MACVRDLAARFLARCRLCAYGTPSGRCDNVQLEGDFRENRPNVLNHAAHRAHQDLPLTWRRVQLALIDPCPGYQPRSEP